MEPSHRQARHDARIVEITCAVLLGAGIVLAPNVVLWLIGRALDLSGTGWLQTRQAVFVVTAVVAAAVTCRVPRGRDHSLDTS